MGVFFFTMSLNFKRLYQDLVETSPTQVVANNKLSFDLSGFSC